MTWKIGVVTNRMMPDQPGADQPGADQMSTGQPAADRVALGSTSLNAAPVARTLSQQMADAIYETPASISGFADVLLPVVRRRGACPLDAKSASRVVVQPWVPVSVEDFYAGLQQALDAAQAQDVFVFVHGFNVSMEAAIVRAAQMEEDTPFHGVMVVFSWQSAASAHAYVTDEKPAERHFWGLADLLANLKTSLWRQREIACARAQHGQPCDASRLECADGHDRTDGFCRRSLSGGTNVAS